MCSNEAFYDECRTAACGIAILPVNSRFLGIFVRYRPFLVVSSLERVFGQHKSLLMQTNETRKSNYFSATNTHAFFWTSSCHLYRGVDLTFWFQQKARFCFSFCLSCLIVCIVDGCSEGTAMFFFLLRKHVISKERYVLCSPPPLCTLICVHCKRSRPFFLPFRSFFSLFFTVGTSVLPLDSSWSWHTFSADVFFYFGLACVPHVRRFFGLVGRLLMRLLDRLDTFDFPARPSFSSQLWLCRCSRVDLQVLLVTSILIAFRFLSSFQRPRAKDFRAVLRRKSWCRTRARRHA